MKKKLLLVTVLLMLLNPLFAQNLYPELYDSSEGILDGYGAWGTSDYISEVSVEVPDKGVIKFYHPDVAEAQKPTIFFISGWGQTYESYDKFFKYLASLGYAVVNIYNYNPGSISTSYQNSLDMMQQAASDYSAWIDTTRVGLMGHSYGGGSTIWLGKQVFDENSLNWGTNGRLIMMFSPWLSFLMERDDLQNYPENVKLLVLQSYDDLHNGGPNYNTDPRAVRAVYELINIPDSEKDFITVFSDTNEDHTYEYEGTTYTYVANHYISYTSLISGENNPFDTLDVYSSNRLANALTSYVFYEDLEAKEVALGNGSEIQKDMGILPDLEVTDYYIVTRPENVFEYKCSENGEGTWGDPSIWKLQDYCHDSDGDGLIDYLKTNSTEQAVFRIFPVPALDSIHIELFDATEHVKSIILVDNTGKLVYQLLNPETSTIDISSLNLGVYYVRIQTEKHSGIQMIIKK